MSQLLAELSSSSSNLKRIRQLISGIMYKLGPQGRAIQQQLQHAGTTTKLSSVSPYPNQLDYLLNDLRNPATDMSIEKQLGYLIHYVPTIKQEYNLKLVISCFLDNQLCFPRQFGVDFQLENRYLIIEAIKLMFEKKLVISQPTLSISKFYEIWAVELANFYKYNKILNSWKVLPVITGILLANGVRDRYKVPETSGGFSKMDVLMVNTFQSAFCMNLSSIRHKEVIYLGLLSLSCCFVYLTPEFKKKLNHDLILTHLVELVFNSSFGVNQYQLNVDHMAEFMNRPVLKHFNRICFVIENCLLNNSNWDIIDVSLNQISLFNQNLDHFATEIYNIDSNPQCLNFLKNLLFAEIIIFQGISTRSLQLSNQNFIRFSYPHFFRKILTNLYHLNFILMKIGTGGFESYNYVYYIALDSLQQYDPLLLEETTRYFVGQCNLLDYVHMKPKILFTLTIWENIVKQCSSKLIKETIFPICEFLTDPEKIKDQDIIESGHSVLLEYYNQPKELHLDVLLYLKKILGQFPDILSCSQLNYAVETLGKILLKKESSHSVEFLNRLYLECNMTPPSVRIRDRSGVGEILTTRQALISCFINLIPYLPLEKFVYWLNQVSQLIERSHLNERKKLVDLLWKTLSENLDMSRSDLGINWWYGNKSRLGGLSQELHL